MKTKLILISVFFVLIVFFALTTGTVHIPLHELLLKENRQIIILRVLRLFLAMSTGGGLAVAGIALQAVLRNPLAEPYLLGTWSGAGLSAVLAILAGLGMVYIPIAAFIGAALSVVAVYFLSKQGGRVQSESLILSGVIVSVALSAIMVFLISIFPDRNTHGILWWLWGSLQVYDIKLLIVVSISVLIGSTGIFVLSQDLNAISLGDEEAVHLGVKAET
ncbi:MAG: iron chelate uptake ABC transporter family permease subunit, partial [Candidatus Omnitrophica bacterium]|nr:iron chelate uptake ABC transporter family permease subunit [Candidatus Omnitrophota bacterium]